MVPPSWQSKTQCGPVVELGCVIAVQFGLCVREEVVQEFLVTGGDKDNTDCVL